MSNKRNIYLKMKTLEAAREIIFQRFSLDRTRSKETVPVPDAVGRVLAEPVISVISSPNFHLSAMDGIAVKAANTFGAAETKPKELRVGTDAFYVNTGHVMPENTDAVIMIEHVHVLDPSRLEIEAPAFPWQNVRKVGEDIVATELLFPQNHVITPYCLGALVSGGIFTVPVKTKPNVLIIPTGSELVDWRKTPVENMAPGQVIESNSLVLGKLVESCGGSFTRHDMLIDDPLKLKAAILDAVNIGFDMILMVGGSSAGSEDHTRRVIDELGKVLVHGVTIMPGKPVLIGKIADTPIFGIPGYPVSAIVAFEQFVAPLISSMLGQPEPERPRVQVEPTRKIASKLGLEEFVRVKLGAVGNKIVAIPLPRGAGCITTLTEADGIIRVPKNLEGIRPHEPVTAELLRPLSSVNNTIVVVGSHDNTLDVLSNQIRSGHKNLTLSSSHVGSMGGLMAIKKRGCHLAGSHLLDTRDGTYNQSYIRKYLPDTEVKLVNLVMRDQGLIVLPKNPKGIRGIEDLSRKDITFINRQAGSGTRILLDYRLKQMGIDPSDVNGYENEEFTHMSVAVAVQSGTVDVALGIYAAAKALNLDFIPVVTEQYDLVIPEIYFESENIQILLETIRTPEFKHRVQALGGYSTEKTGEIIIESSPKE
ncbi:MAG: molybdopterin biosynthesis protein [Deltaproteobacteria bacterium]|nr:molybdopterin biosynthesis protein [Deltaproteobacteria bacterium]MBW1826972.1 molybdopterin biosynthesis protein [Deltaproteobacteria bacterium]MBW2198674.1 molybdopterin biosynthesis protein [Deltaproteobacteria bacterium]